MNQMLFELTPDQRQLQDLARDFADRELRPLASEIEPRRAAIARAAAAIGRDGLPRHQYRSALWRPGPQRPRCPAGARTIRKDSPSRRVPDLRKHRRADQGDRAARSGSAQEAADTASLPRRTDGRDRDVGAGCRHGVDRSPTRAKEQNGESSSTAKSGGAAAAAMPKAISSIAASRDAGCKGIGAVYVERDPQGMSFGQREQLMGFRGIHTADIFLDKVICRPIISWCRRLVRQTHGGLRSRALRQRDHVPGTGGGRPRRDARLCPGASTIRQTDRRLSSRAAETRRDGDANRGGTR